MQWIQSGGTLAVFLAMVIESACIPLPSEVIMPFGGFLAFTGHLSLWSVVIAGTLGNVVGSLIAYWVGLIGGRAVILRFGRYVGLSERHLHSAEKWFSKRGEWAVLISRVLPGVRTFISLPAGIAKMPLGRFTLFTFIGSLPWAWILAYAGYKLGQNWDTVKHYTHPLLYVVVLIIVVFIVWFFVRRNLRSVS